MRSSTDPYGATTQNVTHEIVGTRSMSGRDPAPTGDALSVHEPGGRRLLLSEVTPRSLVTIAGVETDVRSAIHAGLLRQNADGSYASVNAVLNAAPAATAPTEQQQQPDQRSDQPQTDQATAVEPLADQEAEQIMSHAVSKMSPGLGNAVLSEIVSTDGNLSATTTEQLASALGVSPEEATRRMDKVVGAFTEQANAALGGNHAMILEYARAHQPQALRDAMTRQARDGTTAGYRALARSFTEDLATYNPSALLATEFAKANGVREERDGQITVEVPGMGRVGWRAAVRSGAIKPKV